jgi:hypothetical protein
MPQGFAPMPPALRAIFVVCLGRAEKRAVVIDDKIEIRPMMSAVYTADHRFGDASIIVNLLKAVKLYVEDPENYDDSVVSAGADWETIETGKGK